jgi:hypothetical protein
VSNKTHATLDAGVQMSLGIAPDFDPLPRGGRHYVIALQNKPGERDALSHADSRTWAAMTPLIQIVGRRVGKPVSWENVRGWLKGVADVVSDHPFYLDVLRFAPSHTAKTSTGPQPVLKCIYEAARRRGLQFVPVLKVNEARKYVELVGSSAVSDDRGVALRWDVRGKALPPRKTPAQVLVAACEALGVRSEQADVILDFGYLDEDVEVATDDVVSLIQRVNDGVSWRHIVWLASSMPSTLAVVPENSVRSLYRREWEVWLKVRDQGIDNLVYGDYGIQNPLPAQKSAPGMRANVRYTTEDSFLISRGLEVQTEGWGQYRELCNRIVGRPEFHGRDYSWGDWTIESAAASATIEPPRNQVKWRGAGMSHHMRMVTEQLERLLG